ITYGFRRGDRWIEPTLKYTARDLADGSANDDDPGKIRPGANIEGASFESYLTYSEAWQNATAREKQSANDESPIKREGAPEPGSDGYRVKDQSYSAGGRSLERSTVRRRA